MRVQLQQHAIDLVVLERIQSVLRRSQGTQNVDVHIAFSDVVAFEVWELHRTDRTLLLVSRLRQQLADDAGEPSMIKTVRGAGSVFNVQSVQVRMAWRA